VDQATPATNTVTVLPAQATIVQEHQLHALGLKLQDLESAAATSVTSGPTMLLALNTLAQEARLDADGPPLQAVEGAIVLLQPTPPYLALSWQLPLCATQAFVVSVVRYVSGTILTGALVAQPMDAPTTVQLNVLFAIVQAPARSVCSQTTDVLVQAALLRAPQCLQHLLLL